MLDFTLGRLLFIEINMNYSWMYNFEDILFINIDANVMARQRFDLLKSNSEVASFLMLLSAHIKNFVAQTVFLQKL